MAMAMDAGLLPTIKCSNCGMNVEIMSMGDHICPPAGLEPPPPPPKEDAWAAKVPRTGPPPRIDPAAANRPFMQVDGGMNDDSLTPAPLSTAAAQRSFTRPPLPDSPDSPDFGLGASLDDFPMPRAMSLRRPGTSDLKDANSAPPVPSPHYLNAMPTPSAAHDPPRSANLPLEEDDLPPLPVTKDHGAPMGVSHRSGPSIDSKSSYRTSFASSRYGGDISDKRLTTYSSRIASFSSVAQPYRYEDIPPVPTDAIRNALHESAFSDSSMSGSSVKHDSRGDSVGSFDLGPGSDQGGERLGDRLEPDRHRPSPLRVASNPGSERSSTSRRSDELFFRSPSHSMHGAPHDLPDESHPRSKSPADMPADYQAYKTAGSGYLQPTHPDSPGDPHNATGQRKNSDATSDSGLSVSNFARALGLESNHTVASSTASSDMSPSESRSGTSLSSLPSEASLSRRKPSDQGRLGPVLEELQTQGPPLGQIHESPTDLEPPKIPGSAKMAPDSPTDPALGQGSLALRREQSRETDGSLSPGGITRSATEPLPGVPPTPRAKGRCKGCGELIMGKSISSKDGRLTGRYHRNCFVCFDCKVPFQTMDFYVLNDLPFCSQHYHERNGSMCQTCHQGIEGQFLETIERRGMGPVDRVRFHPDCLTCRTCNVILKGEYFEWNGLAYCERDARRAAASVSPHRFRRPTMPSSPLAPPGPPGRGYGPPPPGYGPPPRGFPPGRGPPGRGRGLRPPPGSFDVPYGRPNSPLMPPNAPLMPPPGPRRFPERRTTRLMMI